MSSYLWKLKYELLKIKQNINNQNYLSPVLWKFERRYKSLELMMTDKIYSELLTFPLEHITGTVYDGLQLLITSAIYSY